MKEISLEDTAREPALTYSSIEPQNWKSCHVTFKTQLEGCKGKNESRETIGRAFNSLISDHVSIQDTKVFTDGSVKENNMSGGAGCIIMPPAPGEKSIIKEPTGKVCSSYRAEMWAIYHALTHLNEIKPTLPEQSSIWLFTDSESAISRLQGGPGAQTEQLADAIWKQIMALSDFKITFQCTRVMLRSKETKKQI